MPGPPGWTDAARAAFLAHHRARRAGLAGPHAELTWGVLEGEEVVGCARLEGAWCGQDGEEVQVALDL